MLRGPALDLGFRGSILNLSVFTHISKIAQIENRHFFRKLRLSQHCQFLNISIFFSKTSDFVVGRVL